ncbi:MAG: substrate-binding domain-containing protein [Lachnospiraceae bacterium]|nr:substrate-binding domain-containing protein [Lachnospiraceae bacterium]
MKSSKQEMRLKKGLVLILCLVLLCTTVFACGKDKESNTEEEKEVVSDITGEDSGENSGVDDEVQSDETQNDSEDVSDDTAQGNDEPIQDEDTAQGNDEATQGEDESNQGDDEPIEDIPSQDEELVAEFPRMDGSTSAIPLEAGLRSELYDISYYEALSQVSHTTTHQSFDRLLYAETDLIFSVPLSEDQLNKASSLGVTIEMEPVAKEGFVFVVNANNPVDSLTQEQIRKIYSGKITNWKEVGGNDAPILAYQRNVDSGSQNYMTEFMGDVPLMKPVTTNIPGGMGAMMDAVASYNNAENAIGYSVYSYAAQMYANQNEIKFIEIDGIKPSKATMADGTYPLLSCTYVMYKSNHSRSDELAELVEWMTSEEGQKAVLACGYIPVMDMEIPDNYLPYEAVGTGIEKALDYKPSNIFAYSGDLSNYYDFEYEPAIFKSFEKPIIKPTNKITGLTINFLKDTELQDEINDKIKDMFQKLDQYALDNPEMIFYTSTYPRYYRYDKQIDIHIKNGYMSILIGYPINMMELGYDDGFGFAGFDFYQYCETLCYDLIEGKQIEKFSDLFYQDEEFVPIINNALSNNMSLFCLDNEKMVEFLGVDFSGLLGSEQNKFTLNSIYFNEDSPYFQIPVLYTFNDELMMDSCVVYQYRSMNDVFIDELSDILGEGRYEEYEYYIEHIGENSYTSVLDSRFHTKDEVNERRNAYIHVQDEYRRIFDANNHGWFYVYEEEDCYRVVAFFESPYDEPILYVHKETLQPFTIDDFLIDGWKEYLIETYADEAEFLSMNEYDSEAVMLIPNWTEPDYTTIHYYFGDSSTREWNDFYSFNIPNEYLKREI